MDELGLLKVGPHSAGAEPACYAQGGTEPTVTDASLLLYPTSAANTSVELFEPAAASSSSPPSNVSGLEGRGTR